MPTEDLEYFKQDTTPLRLFEEIKNCSRHIDAAALPMPTGMETPHRSGQMPLEAMGGKTFRTCAVVSSWERMTHDVYHPIFISQLVASGSSGNLYHAPAEKPVPKRRGDSGLGTNY